MKQLLKALPSDVPSDALPRRVPSSAHAYGSARLGLGSSARRWAAMEQTTSATLGRFATLHGANGLMVIPTNGHRRPPETPT